MNSLQNNYGENQEQGAHWNSSMGRAWVNNDTYPLDDAINTIINALSLNSFNDAFEIFKNI